MFGLTSFFFGAVAVVVLLVLGFTIISIFGTAKDKTSSLAERALGWVLVLGLTAVFVGLLLLLLGAAILF
jgi:hypothetical protein